MLSHSTPYVIDELVKKSGRLILRLPPYHCNLNPIELVWAQVKQHVAVNNRTYSIEEVKQLLCDGIAGVTAEKWNNNCINHVIREECWLVEGSRVLRVWEGILM